MDACVNAGAPQAVAAALTAHAGAAAVCEAGCTALYLFALHAPARWDDIVHAGRQRHSVKPSWARCRPFPQCTRATLAARAHAR